MKECGNGHYILYHIQLIKMLLVFYHIEESKGECGDVVFAMLVVHDFVHHH